jgi:CRP/FNR family cyclic AMP-dependent transcriptional regulator
MQSRKLMITLALFRNSENAEPFAAGQIIFTAGDSGDLMYVIAEGNVEVIVKNTSVEVLGPGGVFGEMALLDTEIRSGTAIAKTDCKLVPITRKRFEFLVQQTPHFALQLMRIMADRLRRMDNRL